MNDLFSQFTISNWLEFFGIITSLFVSIISVTIAILSLRQNNKMLEESTRPYIAVSYEVLLSGEPLIYLVIKNYGNTGALITDFSYLPVSKDASFNERISKLKGSFIAPGQKLLYPIKPKHFENDELTFDITYKTRSRSYHEKQSIKIRIGRIITRSNETSSIPYSLQEISERLI